MKLRILVALFLSKINISSAGQVCYNYGTCDLGCFTDVYPWGNSYVRPLSRLPLSPTDVQAKFFLDTKYQQDYLLDPTDPNSIYRSGFAEEFETKFIIHGYTDAGDRKWMYDLSDQFIKNDQDVNVIRVDWQAAATNIDYAQSATDTQVVGGMAMCLLKELYSGNLTMLTEKVHCIGHSLGAHTCGYVGRNAMSNFTVPIARITGLDPAEPYFGYAPAVVALDPTDAAFVDVIHTDTVHFRQGVTPGWKDLTPYGMGVEEPVGHMDFYPNNGTDQPGCDQNAWSTITGLDGLMDGARDFVACNHLRSIKYFNESLILNVFENLGAGQKCAFTGFQCTYQDLLDGKCMDCEKDGAGSVCPSMGIASVNMLETYGRTARTTFRLTTSGSDLSNEFCSHSSIVSVNTGSNTDKTKGRLFISVYGSEGNSVQLEVTDGKTTIASDETYENELDFADYIGELSYVKLMWEKDEYTATRRHLYVNNIEVYWGDDQTSYYFCNNNAQMTDDQRYTFNKC